VNSHVAPDINGHVFQIAASSGGTVVTFFIDGVQVGQITGAPNLPNALLRNCVTVDNFNPSSVAQYTVRVAYTNWQTIV